MQQFRFEKEVKDYVKALNGGEEFSIEALGEAIGAQDDIDHVCMALAAIEDVEWINPDTYRKLEEPLEPEKSKEWKVVEPEKTPTPKIPEGDYKAECVKAEEKQTQFGWRCYLYFVISEGFYKDTELWRALPLLGKRQFLSTSDYAKALCKMVGGSLEGQKIPEPDIFVGKDYKITVRYVKSKKYSVVGAFKLIK